MPFLNHKLSVGLYDCKGTCWANHAVNIRSQHRDTCILEVECLGYVMFGAHMDLGTGRSGYMLTVNVAAA